MAQIHLAMGNSFEFGSLHPKVLSFNVPNVQVQMNDNELWNVECKRHAEGYSVPRLLETVSGKFSRGSVLYYQLEYVEIGYGGYGVHDQLVVSSIKLAIWKSSQSLSVVCRLPESK